MNVFRLGLMMRKLMYTDGKFGPTDRDIIIGFVEKAWEQMEAAEEAAKEKKPEEE